MAANLAQVATLISADPRFSPSTLIVVSRTIEQMETTCPRVSVHPRMVATGACADAKGSIAPKYSAKPTASAAMVPLWPTVKIIQP